MNKFLFGLLFFASLPAFAEELAGLKCTTDYVVHEVMRRPYETNRVILRKSLLGGSSVLGFTPIQDQTQDFVEELSVIEGRQAITYSFDVQAEVSTVSMKLKTTEKELVLLGDSQFKTNEGFVERVSLYDLPHPEASQPIYVILSCLPVYR